MNPIIIPGTEIDITKNIILGLSILEIILAILTLVVGIIIVKILSGLLKKWMLRAKLDEILAEFSTRIIRIILYIFVIGTAIGFLGVDVGAAMVSISVVMGFVLGFALGDTLSNVASGFMIAITKPFKKGDYVDAAGDSGTVKNVGISVTELDTPDNKHIIIPNKQVWGGNITNYTHNPIRRVDMTMGIGYNDDLDKAIKITMDLLKKEDRVLKDPAPTVAVNEMGDSAVGLVIRPWVKKEDYWNFYFDFNKKLKQTYDKEGINIPYPQMDVHLDK